MKKFWRRIVSVVLALAMVLLGLPEYVSPVKTAKAADDEAAHGEYVYVRTTSMTSGGTYLIVGVANGKRYALQFNGTGLETSSAELTINDANADAGIEDVYIKSADVADSAVWEAETPAETDRMQLKNGSTYLVYNNGLKTQESASQYAWSYRNSRKCLQANTVNNYGSWPASYVIFSNNSFYSTTSQPGYNAGNVEVYVRQCVHHYVFTEYVWPESTNGDNSKPKAYAHYTCDNCQNVVDVEMSVSEPDEVLVCGEQPQWKFTATITADKNDYDNVDRTDSNTVPQTYAVVDEENIQEVSYYVLVDKVTAGKKYLIVSADEGIAYALGRTTYVTNINKVETRAREVEIQNGVLFIKGEQDAQQKTYIETAVADAIWTASVNDTVYEVDDSEISTYSFEQIIIPRNQTTEYTCHLFHDTEDSNTVLVYAAPTGQSLYYAWVTSADSMYYIGSGETHSNHYLYYDENETDNNRTGYKWKHNKASNNVYFFEEMTVETGLKYVEYDDIGHLFENEENHVKAVEATCTTPGNIEYWTCDLCDNRFASY